MNYCIVLYFNTFSCTCTKKNTAHCAVSDRWQSQRHGRAGAHPGVLARPPRAAAESDRLSTVVKGQTRKITRINIASKKNVYNTQFDHLRTVRIELYRQKPIPSNAWCRAAAVGYLLQQLCSQFCKQLFSHDSSVRNYQCHCKLEEVASRLTLIRRMRWTTSRAAESWTSFSSPSLNVRCYSI